MLLDRGLLVNMLLNNVRGKGRGGSCLKIVVDNYRLASNLAALLSERRFLKVQRSFVDGSPMVRSVNRGNVEFQAFLLLTDEEKGLTSEEINELRIIC